MENVIEIQHLIKDFKDVRAVNDLSFKVKKGEFFAFLGVIGAGKSTTISIMCGKLSRNSGYVLINGLDIDKDMDQIRKVLGVVYQNNVLDKVLTVYDNLKFRAGLYNITGEEFKKRYEYFADILDFKDLKDRVYGKLSGGQKRRVDIARALLHNPEILILDEPTTGRPSNKKISLGSY